MQEVKQPKRTPATAGGFADLLQAVLRQDDCDSAVKTQHGTANPAFGGHPLSTAPKPSALGDVTNTQHHAGGSTPTHPSGKPCTAAGGAVADRSGKTAAARAPANRGVLKPESKGASRKSARVQTRKPQGKPDKEHQSQATPAVELFSGAFQVQLHTTVDRELGRSTA